MRLKKYLNNLFFLNETGNPGIRWYWYPLVTRVSAGIEKWYPDNTPDTRGKSLVSCINNMNMVKFVV